MKLSPMATLRHGIAAAAVSLSLAGCGLAETSAVAASQGASAAEQAKQGKEMEEKTQRDIEAAEQAAAEARKKAELAAE
jgi:hypothetical protein